MHIGDVNLLTGAPVQRDAVDPDVLAQLKRQAEAWADEDYRTRFLPSARASVRKHSWDFVGRRKALRDVISWLGDPDSRLLIVKGSPGSGKTALLGLVATLADPRRVAPVLLEQLGLAAADLPPLGAFDAVFSVAGDDDVAVRQRLAATAGSGDSGSSLRKALQDRERPLCVLLDGLDEAVKSEGIVSLLLDLLATDGLRLVIGTRPKLVARLTEPHWEVDLDGTHADPTAMAACVARVLLNTSDDSPYLTADQSVVEAVVEAAVEAAGTNFLVARLVARDLAQDETAADAHDEAWRRALPRRPGDAIERELRNRFEQDTQRALDMLTPLAFAQGFGLPPAALWPAMATRLSGTQYDDTDIEWLRENAGSYVVRASNGSYRPYHQTLSDHLRAGLDTTHVHRLFVEFMVHHPARLADGRRDWSTTDSYTRTHLASHLVEAHAHTELDNLLLDQDYLLAAENSRLLHAIQTLDHPDRPPLVRAAADAYRRAAHHFRTAPADQHRAYLDMVARCHGVPNLTATGSDSQAPWTTKWVDWQPRSPDWTLVHVGNRVTAITSFDLADEPHVAFGTESGMLDIYRLRDGEWVDITKAHTKHITAVASRLIDGSPHLLTAGAEGAITVRDAVTGKITGKLVTGDEVIAAELLEMDSKPVVVAACRKGPVLRWWLRDSDTEPRVLFDIYQPACVATFSHDGEDFAVVGDEDGVAVVDLRTGENRWLALCDPVIRRVSSVTAQSYQDRPIAVISTLNHGLYVMDLLDGTMLSARFAPGPVLSVAAVDDRRPGLVVVACDRSPTPLLLWDGLTGETVDTFRMIGRDRVNAVATARWRTGRTVAVTAWDSLVRVWELPIGPKIQ